MHVLVLCFTPCVVDIRLGKEWGKSANTRGFKSRTMGGNRTVPYSTCPAWLPPNSLLVCVVVPAAAAMTPCQDLFLCQEFLMTLFGVFAM
jgi:hypothetical protein